MAQNFHIIGRTGHLPDVQRNNLWELDIDTPKCISPSVWNASEMILKARKAKIPSKDVSDITTDFMGMKQHYAGDAKDLESTLEVDFQEFEDQNVRKALFAWSEAIWQVQNSKQDSAGHSSAASKKEYSTTITMTLYKNNSEKAGVVKFYNAWLKTIGAVDLGYDSTDSIKYSATFVYDYYDIIEG